MTDERVRNPKAATEAPGKNARDRAGDILLCFAAVAIAAAVCAVYINANIFNSANFADRAETVLTQPAVRGLIANEVTDVVVNDVAQDAVAVRPLINTLSSAVIESTAFRQLFRGSLLRLHESAVAGNADDAVLTVANVGILISQGLKQLAPSVGRQIPANFDKSLVRLATFKSVDKLSRIAKASHKLALRLTLISLLLVGSALVVSVNRLRAFGRLGISLAAAGGLIAFAYFTARHLTLSAVQTGSLNHHETKLIWDAFMLDLLSIAVIMIVLGMAVATVADGALRGVRVQDRARSLTSLLSPPQTSWRRVLWAFAAIALGVWAITDPRGLIELAVGLVGLFLIAAGMQELAFLSTSQETLSAGIESGAAPRGHARAIRFAAIGTIGALLLIFVVGAVSVGGGLQSIGVFRNAKACNGDEKLCDRPLNKVAIAATHNSMSVAGNSNWLFPGQEEPISTQLNDGIHGLLLDVYYAYPGRRVYTDEVRSSPKAKAEIQAEFGKQFVDAADRIRTTISKPTGVKPELYLCHGFCELGATKLTDAMSDVRKYMEQNPREVVTITFEDYVPWQALAAEIQKSGLIKYAYRGPWGPAWPTLGKMIGDGGRLLLMTEKAQPKLPWLHNAYDSMQETPFRFETVRQLREPSSCDPMRGSKLNTLFQVNNWVDTAPAPRPSNAKRANAYGPLRNRIERCQRARHLLANVIAVDFYKEGDLFGVVDNLNAER